MWLQWYNIKRIDIFTASHSFLRFSRPVKQNKVESTFVKLRTTSSWLISNEVSK